MTSLAPKANADEPPPYTPKVLPECKVYKTASGKEVCGYDKIETIRELYARDAELVAHRETTEALNQVITVQRQQILDLKIAVEESDKAGKIHEDRSATLAKELIAKDKLYQDERVKPRWGTSLSWGAAAVMGAVLLGYVGNELLE